MAKSLRFAALDFHKLAPKRRLQAYYKPGHCEWIITI